MAQDRNEDGLQGGEFMVQDRDHMSDQGSGHAKRSSRQNTKQADQSQAGGRQQGGSDQSGGGQQGGEHRRKSR